ncbi:TlpA family protein disulfide reductase [Polymorphospora lycopeni]|uniref:TlpA disulfide reductase family protein n=1 Tax=Polymorphospora lycopeni TaxID=3140240 RepID=A0ABV5CJ90_9ACTN
MTGRALVSLLRRPAPVLALLLTAVLGIVLAVGLHRAAGSAPDAAAGAAPGAPAPALAGPTLDGGHFDLADARGRVVLVNVFASWCGPCRRELPLLVDVSRRWSAQGVQLVGINVKDGTAAVRALLAETGAESMTVLRDPDGTLAVGWGARGVPETFVVDRDGRIVDRRRGEVTRQWLEQRVGPLLTG